MFTKVERALKFRKKRNFKLITPCCHKANTDGKFVNYEGFEDSFGYCHSCGETTTPPALYKDEKGEEYQWNETTNSWDKGTLNHSTISTTKNASQGNNHSEQKYIPESAIWGYYQIEPENNLLRYLRKSFQKELVDSVKETYAIGTTKDGGTIFWLINQNSRVQKAKISYYNDQGKRTNKFRVPYKNGDGYFACLFGSKQLFNLSIPITTEALEKNLNIFLEKQEEGTGLKMKFSRI